MRYYIERHSHRIIRGILALVVLATIGLGTKYIISHRGEIERSDTTEATSVNENEPVELSMRALVLGSTSWGGELAKLSATAQTKTELPFSNLGTFGRNQYDAWLGSLGCSLRNNGCSEDVVRSDATKWFTFFALGNDQVSSQASATSQLLSDLGIQSAGVVNANQNNVCEVVSLPARYRMGDTSYKAALLPVAVCSIGTKAAATIDSARYDEILKYSKVLPVWVYVYSGDATGTQPDDLHKSAYRSLVDAGADIVFGVSPVGSQGAESYKGKLIAYSLGNFMYDGTSADTEARRSVGVGVVASASATKDVIAWVNLADRCKATYDTCLDQASTKQLVKPNYTYQFTLVATSQTEDGLVSRGGASWEEIAAKRLDWAKLLPALSYTK